MSSYVEETQGLSIDSVRQYVEDSLEHIQSAHTCIDGLESITFDDILEEMERDESSDSVWDAIDEYKEQIVSDLESAKDAIENALNEMGQ